MPSLVRAAVGIALALALAGCASAPPVAGPTESAAPSHAAAATGATTPTATAAPTPTPSPTPSPTAEQQFPLVVDPADFLLEGTPGVFDADGYWKGHYGFFTDATKTVRCDIRIYSGDPGSLTCAISTGAEPQVTYALPPVDCEPADGNPVDGYSIGINVNAFPDANAGFLGCGAGYSDYFAVTQVLPDKRVIQVAEFACTAVEGEVVCTDSATGALIRFGLGTAEFSG